MSKRKRLRFDKQATTEMDAAADWYESQRPGLGQEFLEELDDCLERVRQEPNLGSRVPGVDTAVMVRRAQLPRFPYAIVYTPSADGIVVVAIAHGHRKPGYWRDRIPG